MKSVWKTSAFPCIISNKISELGLLLFCFELFSFFCACLCSCSSSVLVLLLVHLVIICSSIPSNIHPFILSQFPDFTVWFWWYCMRLVAICICMWLTIVLSFGSVTCPYQLFHYGNTLCHNTVWTGSTPRFTLIVVNESLLIFPLFPGSHQENRRNKELLNCPFKHRGTVSSVGFMRQSYTVLQVRYGHICYLQFHTVCRMPASTSWLLIMSHCQSSPIHFWSVLVFESRASIVYLITRAPPLALNASSPFGPH